MSEHHHSPENTRRIRALVRAAYSPVVWWMGAISALYSLSQMPGLLSGIPVWMGAMVLSLLLLSFVFLTAGASDVFARDKGPVGVTETLRSATQVFGAFLWLIVKAFAIAAVLGLVIYMFYFSFVGAQDLKDVKQVAKAMRPLIYFYATLALLFSVVTAYWLPIVFLRRNFRLFETLGLALGALRQHLGSLVFLAVLLLTPGVILWIGGDAIPTVLAIVLIVVGEWLRWSAYAYCVDVLTSAAPATTP